MPVCDSVTGPDPPEAENVTARYACPAIPVASVSASGLTVIVGQPIMMVYVRLPVQPLLSVAVTMKLKTPDSVGVPDRTPFENDMPTGKMPAVCDNVVASTPPV